MDNPKILKHTTAHHHRQWLDTVNDLPEKARGVEIYNSFEYMTMRLHWNGCGLILHELCHLIHQLVLEDGLGNKMVLDAFGNALESGLYDEVLRRDWAFEEEEMDAAYATINHKEFFAEISVAFLSRGYDPPMVDCFGRRGKKWKRTEEGRKHDDKCDNNAGCCKDGNRLFNCNDMQQFSPPFMSLEVLARGGALGYFQNHHYHHNHPQYVNNNNCHDDDCWMQGIVRIFKGNSRSRGHCNKFFPFTHAQLKYHDPATFEVFQYLWNEVIAQWYDPLEQHDKKKHFMEHCSIGCWMLNHWYWFPIFKNLFQQQNPNVRIQENYGVGNGNDNGDSYIPNQNDDKTRNLIHKSDSYCSNSSTSSSQKSNDTGSKEDMNDFVLDGNSGTESANSEVLDE
jgi:hypothetical protein